jgi:glycosyltransferase involved in cell wall biosynthesis
MPRDELQARRTALIFEPEWGGHQREWLEHLVAFAADHPACRVWFVVAEQLRDDLADRIPPALRDRLRLLALTPLEERLCTMRPLTVAAFARWLVMRRYLRRTGAEAGHFQSFDHLALPMALGFGFEGRTVGGILFRPSVHYGTFGRYERRLGERLRDLRKTLLYRRMLRNKALGQLLTLDPYFARYASRRYRCGGKVVALPDPTHPLAPASGGESGSNANSMLELERHRTVFALFGYIAERKGVLVLLDALRRLPAEFARKAAIVIAGRIEPRIRARIARAADRVRSERPELQLLIEDRWLGSAELAGLVERCDVVLAPYQRFVGSSGVILWAAAAGKPVLTQRFGLIGRLVLDYRLGVAVDTTDAAALAQSIATMIARGPRLFFDPTCAGDLVAGRTPGHFAETIFASLFGIASAPGGLAADAPGDTVTLGQEMEVDP